MNELKRIKYFDYCKGILIILVVFGHIMPENLIGHIWLYSWHMPAFFLINGMLLSYTRIAEDTSFLKRILWNGFKKLLIPYYIYGGLLLIARWINSGFEWENLRWQLFDWGLLCGIGATWFLPCLFFARIFYYGIVRVTSVIAKGKKKIILKLIFSCLFLYISILGSNFNFITLVLYRSMAATFFCVIGDLLFAVVLSLQRQTVIAQVVITIAFMIMCIGFFVVSGRNSAALNVLSFGNPIVYIVNAFLGSASILSIITVLEKMLYNKILKVIEFFGTESLIIMGTHQIVMLLFKIPIKENYLLNLLFCCIVMGAECPIIFMIKKCKSIVKMKGEK